MSQRSLNHLRSLFGPTVWALGVDEVAQVLGKTTRGEKQRIRERMKNGDMPGAVKLGVRHVIAVEDLAEILEPTPKASRPALPVNVGGTGRTGRHRAQHGPRIAFMRRAKFWGAVAGALGWVEEAAGYASAFDQAQADGYAQQARAQAERFRRLFGRAEGEDKRTPPL